MRVRRQESLTQPFVLTSNDLNKLYANFQKWLNKISFEISSKDSLKREFSTLEDLLSFENPPQKEIRSLLLSGFSHDPETSIIIIFEIASERNILISIEGEEDAVMAINNSLEECLSGIKPWYYLLARINIYIASYIIVGTTIATFIIRSITGRSAPSISQVSELRSLLTGLSIGLSLALGP